MLGKEQAIRLLREHLKKGRHKAWDYALLEDRIEEFDQGWIFNFRDKGLIDDGKDPSDGVTAEDFENLGGGGRFTVYLNKNSGEIWESVYSSKLLVKNFQSSGNPTFGAAGWLSVCWGGMQESNVDIVSNVIANELGLDLYDTRKRFGSTAGEQHALFSLESDDDIRAARACVDQLDLRIDSLLIEVVSVDEMPLKHGSLL